MGFKWTYHYVLGSRRHHGTFVSMWNGMQTNKAVAGMWPNDADGNSWSGLRPMVSRQCCRPPDMTVVDPAATRTAPRTTLPISPSTRTAAARSSRECPYRPTSPTCGSSAPAGLQAEDRHRGQGSVVPQALWKPSGNSGNLVPPRSGGRRRHPFISSLTGETCQQIADDFEQRTGLQWTQPLLHYGVFEVVADALKRCPNMDDKEAIVDAIATTKMETIGRSDRLHGAGRSEAPCIRSRTCTGRRWSEGSGSRGPESGTSTWSSSTTRWVRAIAKEAGMVPMKYS